MVWELLQGCINPLYMAEALPCCLILHGDRLTCPSYNMAARALADLSHEGAKRPSGRVITDLLRFKQQRLAFEFVRCRMNSPTEPD